jgi:tRNA G26 N,N-dimethylase Trm1
MRFPEIPIFCLKPSRALRYHRDAPSVILHFMYASTLIYANLNFLPFCGQLAGPMWSGPLHDPEFVGKVIEHLRCNNVRYGTLTRMNGMLTVAKEVTCRMICMRIH